MMYVRNAGALSDLIDHGFARVCAVLKGAPPIWPACSKFVAIDRYA
jgi:hypothetical protein